MSFERANLQKYARFNNQVSADFLESCDAATKSAITTTAEYMPSRTVAPSSFRCARKTWFRLKGQKPDSDPRIDATTDFMAHMGTAIHELIQQRLSEYLGNDWVSVSQYIIDNVDALPWATEENYTVQKNGEETRVEIKTPVPIQFSVDGVIRQDDKLYLLEIKTTENAAFTNLIGPREKDLEQIKVYSSLLNLPDVFILYVDRGYGETKCFNYTVPSYVFDLVWDKIMNLKDAAEYDVAPERLPKDDIWCDQCVYRKTCLQWG